LLYFDNQNKSKMYIIINKTTQESAIIKEKVAVSSYIGISVSTIYRSRKLKWWETSKFIVYNPQIIQLKSNRGGKNNFKGSNDMY
jgi:hypothetical protein